MVVDFELLMVNGMVISELRDYQTLELTHICAGLQLSVSKLS